jgi:hypothetical protein
MAPEVMHGAIDTRVDQFGLGRTMLCALGGVVRPDTQIADLKRALPGQVLALLRRASAVDPARRFLAVADLEAELSHILARGT